MTAAAQGQLPLPSFDLAKFRAAAVGVIMLGKEGASRSLPAGDL